MLKHCLKLFWLWSETLTVVFQSCCVSPTADLQHVSSSWSLDEDVEAADEKCGKPQKRNKGAGERLTGDFEPAWEQRIHRLVPHLQTKHTSKVLHLCFIFGQQQLKPLPLVFGFQYWINYSFICTCFMVLDHLALSWGWSVCLFHAGIRRKRVTLPWAESAHYSVKPVYCWYRHDRLDAALGSDAHGQIPSYTRSDVQA